MDLKLKELLEEDFCTIIPDIFLAGTIAEYCRVKNYDCKNCPLKINNLIKNNT